MERRTVDVAIVGAGPAGMVAACLLARAGTQTLVLERNQDFDREFRGEILQPRFQRALRDVGLYDHVAALPHDDIDGAHLFSPACGSARSMPADWIASTRRSGG